MAAQVESLQKVRKMVQFAFSGIAVGMAWRDDGGLQPGVREPIRKHQEIKSPWGRGSPNGTVMKIEFTILVSDCMLRVQRDRGASKPLFYCSHIFFPNRNSPLQIFVFFQDNNAPPLPLHQHPARWGSLYVLGNFMDFAFQRK